MPRVSVIIPCFNHGEFIDEAVESVLRQTYRDFELIIVDDGSDDEHTRNKLAAYEELGLHVVFTPHRGLPSARNAAIKHATGEYILPLDADDKIHQTYLEKSLCVMDSDKGIGIVYCRAEFFGEKSGEWYLPEYSLERLLLHNMIFCTALTRRTDLERVGGYNENMATGYEDWNLWLSLINLGRKVHRIPEILFCYRVRQQSMARKMTKEDKVAMHLKLIENHKDLYNGNLSLWAEPLLENWLTMDEMRIAYSQVLDSRLWRLTEPIRKARRLMKRA